MADPLCPTRARVLACTDSDQSNKTSTLSASPNKEPTADGTTQQRVSPEIVFGEQYDDDEIPIADICDVEGVRARSRPRAVLNARALRRLAARRPLRGQRPRTLSRAPPALSAAGGGGCGGGENPA